MVGKRLAPVRRLFRLIHDTDPEQPTPQADKPLNDAQIFGATQKPLRVKPCRGFFMRDCLHWIELNRHHKDSPMAATKKKPASKKNEPKKVGFFPKVKSTKKNGLGSY